MMPPESNVRENLIFLAADMDSVANLLAETQPEDERGQQHAEELRGAAECARVWASHMQGDKTYEWNSAIGRRRQLGGQ
jgi:hypothetical protein